MSLRPSIRPSTVLPSLLLGTIALTACIPGDPPVLPVHCETLPGPAGGALPVQAGDTLLVLLHLDSISADSEGELLMRVDALGEGGAIVFATTPPPTMATAAAALTLAGVFQGCLDEAAAGFRLRTPLAPRAKAWLRVSADRPVRVRVETGEPGLAAVRASEDLVVEPGTSGQIAWSRAGADR